MITLARSKDIWGTYESCPRNPILSASGTSEYIQHTGHCDAFQDQEGRWWGVCLGVRKDNQGRFIMGRETFLTTANWDGEWITFDRVKINPKDISRPTDSETLSTAPNVDFLHIRDVDLTKYRTADDSDAVIITSSPIDLSHAELSPSFLGKRQRLLEGQSSVIVQYISEGWAPAKLKAGLACYKDEYRFARIYYDASSTDVVFELTNMAQNVSRTERHSIGQPEYLALCIMYTEKEYQLAYKLDKDSTRWTILATIDTLLLTDLDFVGPVIGAYAVSETGPIDIEFVGLSVQ
jgi:beta-xylosidase